MDFNARKTNKQASKFGMSDRSFYFNRSICSGLFMKEKNSGQVGIYEVKTNL
jgi:hypothetical protein